MKKLFVRRAGISILALACWLVTGSVEGASPIPLYRHHFAGTTQIAKNPESAALRQIWALPESVNLRNAVFQKIATAPFRHWRQQLPAGTTDQAARLQPLLNDLATAESYLEIHGSTSRAELALAIQLDDQRAGVWSTTLRQVAAAWKLGQPAAIQLEGFSGWTLKKPQAPNLFQFVQAGKWVVVGLGHDRLTALPRMLQQIRQQQRPGTALGQAWLEVEADCPRLAGWFPSLSAFEVPPAQLTVTGKEDQLRTHLKLQFADKIAWTPEPWKIPVSYVREPLISFTVARGIAPLLAKLKGVSALGLKPLPNQFCLWGQASTHVQSCLAFPVSNATNVLKQIAPRVPPVIRQYVPDAMGEFFWASNKSQIMWRKLPFVFPTLIPIRDGRTEYLYGSLMPVPPKAKPPPNELFTQFTRKNNLLYYDWELTQERLPQENRLYQILNIVTWRQIPRTNAPTLAWIAAASPKLGNTVTEITQSGPKELTLLRKSRLGLTGFEIATLTRWIESPGFPLTFEPQPFQKTKDKRDSSKKR